MSLIDDTPEGTNAPELTVSELSRGIKRTLETTYGRVRVRGELGRVTFHRNGHCYLDLKDENAVLAGVIWKSAIGGLDIRPQEGDEGIATGFESNGERIDVHPARVNSRYARQAKQRAGQLTWESVISDDSAFRGDILAGDAYTNAWCLHWTLVKRFRDQYRDYVISLAAREPLQELTENERLRSFEAAFGTTVNELFADFPRFLDSELRRQKVSLRSPNRAGELVTQEQLGEVRMKAIRRADLAGQLLVQGELRNASPFRALSFHVTVETDAGLYAEWFVPDLASGRKVPLKRQVVRQQMQNAPGGLSQTFRVRIRSALPDSDDAAAWKQGDLPVPVFGQ